MKRYSTKSVLSRRKGVAIVEFVIVLPVCLLLMIATAEFGRAFMQYNTLTKSIRFAVRHVASNALPGQSGVLTIDGALQTESQNLVVYGNTLGTGSVILPGLTTAAVTVADAGGGNVSISVTYPYAPIFALIPGFIYGGDISTAGINLQAAVTMRALG